MAFTHIQYNPQLSHGSQLRAALLALEHGYEEILKAVGVIETMRDGDGSLATHFAEVVTRFGVEGIDSTAALVNAKALHDELQSLKFKLTTNASITDMNAALIQAWNKLRV